MNIHALAPDFRLRCFLKRRLPYVPLRDFQGNPIILCYHHAMNEQDVCFLETRAAELANSGWTLARLRSRSLPSGVESWSRPFQEFDLPIVTDPLKRFHRACTLFQNFSFRRCEPLVFGHQLHLKFRVSHNLNRRAFSPVWKFAKRDLFQHVPIRGFVNLYRLILNFLSPFNSETGINDGKRKQGFMNSLLIFSTFAPEGIQAPSPSRTTNNGENHES